jgi:hypothetical protein
MPGDGASEFRRIPAKTRVAPTRASQNLRTYPHGTVIKNCDLRSGSWRLKAGCWQLVAGCWWLVAGGWLLAAGSWLLSAGGWQLVAGSWWLAATLASS